MRPSLVGVGVGPGDPSLLTMRAVSVLRDADRVLAPAIALDAAGRAESIVRQALPDVRVERIVFAVLGDEGERRLAHEEAASRVVSLMDDGERVAFVTLGDPNVYSTFSHLAAAVTAARPAACVETVPGIMAFQELAARSGTLVVDASERLHLLSAVEGPEVLDIALADPEAAIVVYKGGRHVPAIAARLEARGRLDDAVFGELLGLPGEKITSLEEVSGSPATYLASVLVPPRRVHPPSERGSEGRGEGS